MLMRKKNTTLKRTAMKISSSLKMMRSSNKRRKWTPQ
jgi:hypothetical protein